MAKGHSAVSVRKISYINRRVLLDWLDHDQVNILFGSNKLLYNQLS